MNRIKKNHALENIAALSAALLAAGFFLLNSPLHPWRGEDPGTDSAMLKAISMMIEKGAVPYRDSFDHKGPLIYLINWLGDRISAYRGVWVIELFFLTVTIFLLYRTARLFCQKGAAAVATFLSLSLLFQYFEGGNLVEEYALPFLAGSLFLFLDYLKREKISPLRLLLCGSCLGAVLLLRPNMIALWAVLCPAIFFQTLAKRNWPRLLQFVLWFLLGMAVILCPAFLYFAVHNALFDWFDAYILFNMTYSAASLQDRWHVFSFFFFTPVCLGSFLSLLFFLKKEDRFLNGVFLLYLILDLLLLSLSGYLFPHYGMILVPAVIYPMALLCSKMERTNNPVVSRAFFLLAILLLILPGWGRLLGTVPRRYQTRNETHRSGMIETVSRYVMENVPEEESISVYGNWGDVYVASHRKHATRFPYQFPIGRIRPEIMDEYMKELQEELPRMIVVQGGYADERILAFLNDHGYRLLWESSPDAGNMLYLR